MNATSHSQIWEETLENGIKIYYLCDRTPNEIRILIPDETEAKPYYFNEGITEEVIERIHRFVNF